MDRPVGSGYGSGFYILTRSTCFFMKKHVQALNGGTTALRGYWFGALEACGVWSLPGKSMVLRILRVHRALKTQYSSF